MKMILILLAAALCGFTPAAFAQTDSSAAAGLVNAAKSSSDSQLGDIASQLTGKVAKLESLLGTNSAIKDKLDSTLKSLTGGADSDALTSAFGLVKGAKLTPDQLGLAKQVGNLASAFVVQRNFTSLEGAQGDVATIVSSLREGKVTAAVPALKNVATNAHLTDGQKQLITTIADKYAPGWENAKGAMDAVKKLPGF
jgi:hypothetical protein